MARRWKLLRDLSAGFMPGSMPAAASARCDCNRHRDRRCSSGVTARTLRSLPHLGEGQGEVAALFFLSQVPTSHLQIPILANLVLINLILGEPHLDRHPRQLRLRHRQRAAARRHHYQAAARWENREALVSPSHDVRWTWKEFA